jgi:hypothetical protein
MSVLFRLELASPATNTKNAFTKILTNADNQVRQISVALKKEKGRSSYLTAEVFDPRWELFDKLPDPAFHDVPVRLYMPPLKAPQSPPILVFDGMITTLDENFPDWRFTIVAHDKSFKARLNAAQRVVRNKNSVQAAQELARRYGLTVEIGQDVLDDVANRKIIARAVDISIPATAALAMSDWQQITRMLESDGLRGYMKGRTLIVEKQPRKTYKKKITPADTTSLNVRIQHVRGPGHGGNIINPAFEGTDSQKAVFAAQGALIQDFVNSMTAGQARTHRKPVGGRPANHDGSHAEAAAAKWTNKVTRMAGRKDEAQWTGDLTPDLFPDYYVTMSGWGAKVNGDWEIEEVNHILVPGDNGAQTTMKLVRGASKQAAKSADIPFGSNDDKLFS